MTGDPGFRSDLIGRFFSHVPHNRALGLAIELLDEGRARIRLPYRAELVGDPMTGVLHGGAITSLLDACCGAAVFMKLTEPQRIATLDLRIDYLKPSLPPHDVLAEAECYKMTRHVAFVRSVAYNSSPDDPVASAVGTFMVRRERASRRSSGSHARRS
jgi:uncharacterized protein (TIGR00369 family)